MNPLKYKLLLDCRKNGTQADLYAKVGDTEMISVAVTLNDGSTPIVIDDDCEVVIRAKKADGTVIYNDCTIDSGVIKFTCTSQYFAVAGDLPCELQVIKGDKVLYTPKFRFIIEENLYDDSEIESTDEYTELTTAISTMNALATKYTNVTAEATTLETGEDATASVTVGTSSVGFEFGLPRGDKGEKGDKGDQGIQGIQGEQGIQGIQGEKGNTGDKGDKGDRGQKPIVTFTLNDNGDLYYDVTYTD